jgi:hypothetical protein
VQVGGDEEEVDAGLKGRNDRVGRVDPAETKGADTQTLIAQDQAVFQLRQPCPR